MISKYLIAWPESTNSKCERLLWNKRPAGLLHNWLRSPNGSCCGKALENKKMAPSIWDPRLLRCRQPTWQGCKECCLSCRKWKLSSRTNLKNGKIPPFKFLVWLVIGQSCRLTKPHPFYLGVGLPKTDVTCWMGTRCGFCWAGAWMGSSTSGYVCG